MSTTGAIRSTPQEALDIIFCLEPLDLFIKGAAAKKTLRLSEFNLWKTQNYRHTAIL